MKYEASGDDYGNYFISEASREVLKIPVFSITKKLTVCEFTRTDPSISLETILKQIRDEAIYIFVDGYESETLELVDLDNQTWTRVPFFTDIAQMEWVKVRDQWPPDIAHRKTLLPDAPRPNLKVILGVDGHRYKWTAAHPSHDGQYLATSYGKKGNIWLTDLRDGSIEKLPAVGAQVMQLIWGKDGTFLATERQVDHVHVYTDGAWHQIDLGTGHIADVALSPEGKMLAITTMQGLKPAGLNLVRNVTIFDWPSLTQSGQFLADPNATQKPGWSYKNGNHVYGIVWSTDSERLFIGHSWPIIGIYDWRTGGLVYSIEGNMHFQQKLTVGPQNQVACVLVNDNFCIYDDAGQVLSRVPYPFGWGAFARDAQLLITENDGLAKVWDIQKLQLVGAHPCAENSKIFVLDDKLVLRNPKEKQLQVCALPEV